MGYYLGIDLGTSYFKAGLFDEDGRLQGMGRRCVKKNVENGITCELPVDVFWKTLQECVEEAMLTAETTPEEVFSMSYSSQANSFVLLGENNELLTSLILWPDKRAEQLDLPAGLSDLMTEFQNKTGIGIDFGHEFAAAKIRWFHETQPRIWEKVRRVMSISDYFIFKLTGQKVSDYSTASLTGLFDVRQCQWWDEILQLFHIKPEYLSNPVRTGTYIGNVTTEGGQLLGLRQGISVVVGGLDHHVAAIGAGVPFSANISESTGTVLACVNYYRKYLPKENICIAPGLDGSHFFQMSFDKNGATSLEWYQKEHAPEFSIPELLEMAARVEPGSDGLVARPYASKFPGLDGFQNIRTLHHHGHFVRAILESTSNSLVWLLRCLPGSEEAKEIISTGGGAKSRLWIQVKANMLGKDFCIPKCSEAACLGAAMLGAIAVKTNWNLGEIFRKWARNEKIISQDSGNNKNL